MEILEMKSTITETKNVFNKLINELGITKERKLEDRPIQIIWTEMQRKKTWKNITEHLLALR